MNIEEMPTYIAFIRLKPTEEQIRQKRLECAQELFKSGVLSLDDMLDAIKMKGEEQGKWKLNELNMDSHRATWN